MQPKNEGIRVEGFASSTIQDAGYIVVDIPRSERRPHRSEASDQKQYFKRSGSSSYPMEHYDIEDAFRRVSVPSLELHLKYHVRVRSGSSLTYQIGMFIQNTSRVTAFFPSITFWNMQGINYAWDDGVVGVDVLRDGGRITAQGNSEFVIHPGSSREIAKWRFTAFFDENRRPVAVGDEEPHMARVEFDYFLAARDFVTGEQHLEFPLFPLRWDDR